MTDDTTEPKPVRTEDIDAVSQVLLQAGLYLGEEARRRERAAWFCEHYGDASDMELFVDYAERESRDGRSSGLLHHILNDGSRTKEVLAHVRHRAGRKKTPPAMDIPSSDARALEEKARWNNMTVPEYEREREDGFIFEAWLRGSLEIAERKVPARTMEYLQVLADHFDRTVEGVYDIVDTGVRKMTEDHKTPMSVSDYVDASQKQKAKARKSLTVGASRR